MSDIVISGMSGFLGRNLEESLNENNIKYTGLHGKNDCDLLNFTETFHTLYAIKPSILIHMAGAVGGIFHNITVPADLMLMNLRMGMNIIEAGVLAGVKRIILLGTVCSYPKYTPCPFKTESLFTNYPDHSNRPYGVAKLALMELLCAVERQYGIKHHTLMTANLYGKYDNFANNSNHVIPALIKRFIHAKENNLKEVTCFGSGECTRDLLYAKDACSAIIKSIQNENIPQIINIGTGIETSIKELAYKISNIVGYTGKIIWDTTKSDGQPRRVLETSQAKEILDWSANTSLYIGLQKTINWYTNHGA